MIGTRLRRVEFRRDPATLRSCGIGVLSFDCAGHCGCTCALVDFRLADSSATSQFLSLPMDWRAADFDRRADPARLFCALRA